MKKVVFYKFVLYQVLNMTWKHECGKRYNFFFQYRQRLNLYLISV